MNGNVYLTCLRQTLTLKRKHCLWHGSSLWLDLGNKSPLVEARGIAFLVGYSRKEIKYAGIHKFCINSFVACQICKTTAFSLIKVCSVANVLYVKITGLFDFWKKMNILALKHDSLREAQTSYSKRSDRV